MKQFKIVAFLAIAGLAALASFGISARAQVPSVPGPYNIDLGAIITNTARGAGTVNSAAQTNLAYSGVLCTFNQASHTGTPSTTIAIQAYDSASASYQTLVTSGAITADTTPTSIVVRPGIQTSSLPTGMVALNMVLPRVWRLVQVITGTTPGVTGTVGCNYAK